MTPAWIHRLQCVVCESFSFKIVEDGEVWMIECNHCGALVAAAEDQAGKENARQRHLGQGAGPVTPDEFARYLVREDADIREGMRATIATTLDPELSAFDKGAEVALRALAESFENAGMTSAAQMTRRALAVVEYGPQIKADPLSVPWCPEHGYGCEPQDCPCGHSLRCDCVGIQNEH